MAWTVENDAGGEEEVDRGRDDRGCELNEIRNGGWVVITKGRFFICSEIL